MDNVGNEILRPMFEPARREGLLQENLDLDSLMVELEEQMESTRSKQTRKKLAKRLKVTQGFKGSNSRPEWMVKTVSTPS